MGFGGRFFLQDSSSIKFDTHENQNQNQTIFEIETLKTRCCCRHNKYLSAAQAVLADTILANIQATKDISASLDYVVALP